MKYGVFFYSSLLFFVGLSIFSPSYFTFWMSMEISIFFFLSLLSEKVGGVKSAYYESVWKYYFVQVLSSLLLIFFLLFSEENFTSLSYLEKWGIFFTIYLKMGLFPFHGWGYHVAESVSWGNLFLLSSVVKIPPLFLLSSLVESEPEILFLLLSIINGSVMVLFLLKELSLKWFFLTSSNYLMSWIMLSSSQGSKEFFSFIFSYLIQSMVVVSFLNSISSSGGGFPSLGKSSDSFSQSIALLALMGMPPFSIFMSKMTMVLSMQKESSSLLALLLLLLSFVASFIYFKSVVLSELRGSSFFYPFFLQKKLLWFLPVALLPSFFFFL